MNERKTFQMTDEQVNQLLEACKPVPYIVIGGIEPRSPMDKALDIWKEMGLAMGFDPLTVEPAGEDIHYFSAVPTGEKE